MSKKDRIIRLCSIVFFYNNVEVNFSLPVYYFEIPMSRPKVLNIYYTILLYLTKYFLYRNNYRSIALATTVSKTLEIKCREYLTTSDNQFGFKSCHSTDLCIYTLKEFIEYYKNMATTV